MTSPGRDDEPRPLGAALDRVVRSLGATPAALGGVFDGWEDLVGEDVAAHARPGSLREGVLVVVVDDPAWATQLRYLEATLVERLRVRMGADAPRSIVVRVDRG